MSFDFNRVEFASNPEPRCPCILLLDTSGSMGGDPIKELNAGLRQFTDELTKDSLAALRVEVAIITFGPVRVNQDFVTVGQFTPPHLNASGDTPMGEAIDKALDMLADRKLLYKQTGLSHFRPWIFLITDGAPTDDWQNAAKRVHDAEANKKVAFFAVGVNDANMGTLARISVTRQPLRLKGLMFREMFLWLSSSLRDISRTEPDMEEPPLQTPLGWGTL